MKNTIALFCLSLGLAIPVTGLAIEVKQTNLPPLVEQSSEALFLGLDEQLWGNAYSRGDKEALIRAVNHSLNYLNTNSAARAYRNYPVPGITRARVIRSLRRFRQLLQVSRSAQELQAAVVREFIFYKSIGHDDQGTVLFTAYFEPEYTASTVPTSEYRYPLYRKPSNFSSWRKPHPTRAQLEGVDGLLGNRSPLAGNELVWMKDRLEAYLVQVQGSARLRLTNGRVMSVGFAGNTDYGYVSMGRELVNDGIFTLEEINLPLLIEYFRNNPEKLDEYLPRNNRFIFFGETNGAPARGSIGVPVTADRSIATDKSLMPPGALALIQAKIPYANSAGEIEMPLVSRYVLDQDTGSAIKSPGRVDIFMGTGKIAGERAGLMNDTGSLYYLLLRE